LAHRDSGRTLNHKFHEAVQAPLERLVAFSKVQASVREICLGWRWEHFLLCDKHFSFANIGFF
jgi:hypothetical protein